MLKGKNIILGVTGSIAAYKAASLIRLLVKEGAGVRVVMTPLAKAFITPLTMATLSKNPVMVDFYNPENGDWNSHVAAGMWADLLLVAPASANTMGKMAAGIADNLLLTTYLSAKCPVMVVPAMDLDMYRHPATQRNMEVLKGYGNHIIEPEAGELASGLMGKGRMAEPEVILARVVDFFSGAKEWQGKRVLVTVGPTYERIDAVRFIGNYSTGKMGYALVGELHRRGAEVVVVSGPVSPGVECDGVRVVRVESADEMYRQVMVEAEGCDVVISCAAVADFTLEHTVAGKIKRREGEDLVLKLKPTKDIAAELGRRKRKGQLLIGFALETEHETEHAFSKLERKNLDMIVLNSLDDAGSGFGTDTNKVTLIYKDGRRETCDLKTKAAVAKDIVDRITELMEQPT